MSNEEMVKYLLDNKYADERVADAMRKVPREPFVPKVYTKYAYADQPLPIGFGQTISAPSIVAVMTKYLEVEEGQKILEVGSGSGWQAAILAELVGPNGAVFTVERVPELIEMVTLTLSTFKYKNITLSPGDGTLGREDKAPFDRIMVTAAAPYVPKPLVDQLGEGGRMIIPVGPMFGQMLTLVTRNKEVEYEDLMPPVMFVPLIGKYGYKEGQV